jgi:two-component system response regulator GlrR
MSSTVAPRTDRIDCSVVWTPSVHALEVVEGPERGRVLRLEGASVAVIGAGEEADFQLHDPTVSRRHVHVAVMGAELEVRDLGALNGVFINDQRVVHGYLPAAGRLRLGRSVLRPVLLNPNAAPGEAALADLVAHSPAMRQTVAVLRMLGGRDEAVVVTGEPGAGKARVARVLHALGRRRARRLEIREASQLVNPPPLDTQDSLLILGLDDLTPRVAEALLVALCTPPTTRLLATAGPSPLPHVQAVLSRLEALGAVEVPVPPLRARREDIPALVSDLLPDVGAPGLPLGPTELGRIQARSWPGNVRELKDYLRVQLRDGWAVATPRRETERIVGAERPYKEARGEMLEAFEREYIQAVLQKHEGNVSQAARHAEIDRVYLHRLMKKHGL